MKICRNMRGGCELLPGSVVALAVLVALGQGCSSGGGRGGGAIPIGQYGNELAKTYCKRAFTCCDAGELAGEGSWGASEAECVANLSAELAGDIAGLQADVDAGRVVYHGDEARRCLDNVTSLACADYGVDVYLPRVPGCLQVIEGTLPVGEACSGDDQCMSHSCGPTTTGTGMACVAVGAVNDACSTTIECEPGLFCSSGTCQVPFLNDAPCTENAGCMTYYCYAGAGFENAPVCRAPMTCNGL